MSEQFKPILDANLNGKEVARIFFPDVPEGQQPYIEAGGKTRLVYCSRYLGDHSEDWVLYIVDGKEIARHNTRYLDSIVWKSGEDK